MHKRILAVVDDRAATPAAIRHAIAMAHALRADVYFFCVLPPPRETSNPEMQSGTVLAQNELHNETAAHAKSMLAAASALAEDAGIQSFRTTGYGADSAQCVSDAAKKKHCDLIVVGAEDKNPVLQLLQGSIVAGLLSVAPVPVLVCRETRLHGGFKHKTNASVYARQQHYEMRERRGREEND